MVFGVSVTFFGGGGKMREIDVRVNFALLVVLLVRVINPNRTF